MISYIKGKLIEIHSESIVVETGGIGIEIYVPAALSLPDTGDEIIIYTYFKVSEDAMSLYGFLSRQDLDMFKQVISVSGIGPKGGLAILSTLSPDELRTAILTEDVKTVSKAQGIGAKTAKRLILDLKDKIDMHKLLKENNVSEPSKSEDGSKEFEVIEALYSLGYSTSDAARAVREIDISKDMKVEDILKLALKKLAVF
ncbi:Holliday junction DNA helicase RuvA [Johnsonella ignava ATCC 51276]|uniref:Holliday junction branch migration complex subunit RuvA n=1 Tax=Johnsonella ignava ATCC 51276 TaxID=679200 RepID=G5GGA3_9FIRM|nr:Holliday junction branch migration protein RuvA [Johnsonella ignava]EHI56313.1 Holliday junction DNA helicase RuvA [Johnsonella ignava ATCC 51276]